jgi:hypothetical protein
MSHARKLAVGIAFVVASSTLVACGGSESDASRTASAVTTADCQTGIADLRTLTQVLTYANASKDLTGLLGKLDAASAKLDAGKLQDAIQKLSEFEKKVASLAADGKIVAGVDANGVTVTPADVIAAADASIACITALIPVP